MKKNWYEIKNGEKSSSIYIYDEIGKYDVSAKQFIKDLDKTSDIVDIHVNSPGGNVFEGFAIYNAIESSPKKINVYVDGIAASIASVIAMAADKVYIAKNAQMMIHRVSGGGYGSSKNLKKTIELMEQVESEIVKIYSDKTGIPSEEIMQMMDDETWMNSKTSVEKGFADEITAKVKVKNKYDMEIFNQYKHTPENIKKQEVTVEITELENKIAGLEALTGEQATEITNLKAKLLDYEKEEIKNLVTQAIKDGKLLPAQKDWALKLAQDNRASFESYLKTAKVIDLSPEHLLDEKDAKLKYEDLLEDLELRNRIKEENPELFEKLHSQWINKR